MTRCPRCEAENPADALFCTECGANVEAVCPACGTDNGPAARFCRKCGAGLRGAAGGVVADPRSRVSEQATPDRGRPEGERRQLTVMFCDLVDSVVLGARLDPEELHEVMRAYQEACARIVRSHGGDIAHYAGDGLFVYFGYPRAHENDAERAVQAGLGILEEIARLNVELERTRRIRLAVRIGIHSGLVVVAGYGGGSDEVQVLGHTVNVAARLQGVAEPDSVVVSVATHALVRGIFVTRDLGPQVLKGIVDPVGAYRVLAPTGVRNRLDLAAETGLTPFVGREHEIALLLDRWEGVNEGHGQAVLLRGEAGIGKSRLIRTLRERLASHAWIETHCSPYHEHSAFYPLAELLERGLELGRAAAPAAKIAALERALEAAGLPVAEVAPLFASLLSLEVADRYPVVTASAEARRRRTIESVIAWLLHRGAQGPTVLVVDDLHWIDPSSKELFGLLLEQIQATPMLLLFTARPTAAPPWPQGSNLTHLALQPLTRQQVGAMIEQIAGGARLPPDVRRQVVTKTDGVPLFVEELTKAVLESDLLRDNAASPGRPAERELAIPSTLQDSLMARLDRLGPHKVIAQVAAVLGREFSHALLAAVADTEEGAVESALAELVRAELVHQRGMAPLETYRFKHALVQETAYQSLLRSRRQEAHARVARVLAKRFPERVASEPEEMARHCMEGGLAEEAIGWYRLAGERAAQRSAHAEALAHFGRGLEVLSARPAGLERDRLELVLRVALGPPMIAIRGYGDPEVERTFERARDLCRQIGDAPHLFEAVWGLANYYQSRSELGAAQALSEQLVGMAAQGGEARLAVWAHLQLGGALFWRGDPAAAIAHLEVAIAHHEPGAHRLLTGATDPGVAARVYAALALWQLGQPDRALSVSREGVAAGRVCGDALSLALALCFSGILLRLRREPDAVRALAEEAIELSTAQDFPLWRGLGRMLLGWALAHSGAGEQGLDDIQQGLAQLASIGTEVGASGGMALLADAALVAGRIPAALNAVEAGLAVADLRDQHTWDAELQRLRGEIVLAGEGAGGKEEAEPFFVQALETARRQQATMLELRAATSLGRLLQRRGRGDEARELLAVVYGRFTEGFDTPDLRDARSLLAPP
jgi:class 3 adenylate cyclase/predicted ATPase/ribosomal protein L40E